MKEVEFGYPSGFNWETEALFAKYAENDYDISSTVGRIPVEVLESIFEIHSGIDWDKTLSVEAYTTLMR